LKRVLVAEDDPAIRAVLAEALADEGYAIATAADGQLALEEYASFRPDVVVLDLMMPVVDGFEFLHRREPSCCSVPVVVITAAYRPRAFAPDLGVAALILKPFDIRVLVRTLAAVLGA
jgi:two-component system alkaline phosphatase synthesis response regulator PhoP